MSIDLRPEERINIARTLGESHFREFKSAIEQNPKEGPRPRDVKLVASVLTGVQVTIKSHLGIWSIETACLPD